MKNTDKTRLATAIFNALPMEKLSDTIAKPDATEASDARLTNPTHASGFSYRGSMKILDQENLL